MYRYPVTLKPDDNGTILVTFPDVPEAITFGETRQDALHRAAEALEAALSIYMDQRRDVPVPSRPKSKRNPVVGLPALSEAKVALYEAMRAEGVRKAELARRLGWHKPQVDRLLNLQHDSKLDQLEQAFAILGRRLYVGVDRAA